MLLWLQLRASLSPCSCSSPSSETFFLVSLCSHCGGVGQRGTLSSWSSLRLRGVLNFGGRIFFSYLDPPLVVGYLWWCMLNIALVSFPSCKGRGFLFPILFFSTGSDKVCFSCPWKLTLLIHMQQDNKWDI